MCALRPVGSRHPLRGPARIPTVVHLHGGELTSGSDGAPTAWFTSDGRRGPGYSSIRPTDPTAAIYEYPNEQQTATLWFHDHALGVTRLNSVAGSAYTRAKSPGAAESPR